MSHLCQHVAAAGGVAAVPPVGASHGRAGGHQWVAWGRALVGSLADSALAAEAVAGWASA